MKIAFDTNVLIDAIVERNEYPDVQALIMAVAQERLEGVISANTITDIYYILRKRIGDGKAREALWNLMSLFEVAAIDSVTCETALNSPMKDFEDAVLAVCAKTAGADKIVTGDLKFLEDKNAPIEVTTVKDALASL